MPKRTPDLRRPACVPGQGTCAWSSPPLEGRYFWYQAPSSPGRPGGSLYSFPVGSKSKMNLLVSQVNASLSSVDAHATGTSFGAVVAGGGAGVESMSSHPTMSAPASTSVATMVFLMCCPPQTSYRNFAGSGTSASQSVVCIQLYPSLLQHATFMHVPSGNRLS